MEFVACQIFWDVDLIEIMITITIIIMISETPNLGQRKTFSWLFITIYPIIS